MEIIKVARRILVVDFDIKDLGMVLSIHGGVAECKWNLLWTREVCTGDSEEVQDDGLQGHDHAYGIEPDAIE